MPWCVPADAKSKWITQLGMPSAAASTQHSIPPLVHMPPHLASSVLYGQQNFQGKVTAGSSAFKWLYVCHSACQQPTCMASRTSKVIAGSGMYWLQRMRIVYTCVVECALCDVSCPSDRQPSSNVCPASAVRSNTGTACFRLRKALELLRYSFTGCPGRNSCC
jgi:hypothetical protein